MVGLTGRKVWNGGEKADRKMVKSGVGTGAEGGGERMK